MSRHLRLLATFAFLSILSTARAGQWVDVPVGVTNLLDDPACAVGFQRDGEKPFLLGWRWTGFDSPSGVYFVPERRGGRAQVFMHCPWRKGPGVAFADFPLRLPQTKRIQLRVRCGLRPTAPHSDGVTYRVKMNGQTVWEANGAWKKPRAFAIDLSRFAGQEATLRLEVDPGPKRETRDDWSVWSGAEILAGSEAEIAAARARRARERAQRRRRAFEAAAKLADADLAPFARGDAASSRPSAASPVRNTLSYDGDACVMLCQARDETIAYRFAPKQGLLAGLSVRVNGRELKPAPFKGGAHVVLDDRRYAPCNRRVAARLESARVEDGWLVCRYRYSAAGAKQTARLTARLRAEGKSLALALEGEANRFDGFEVQTAGGESVPTPFCTGPAPAYRREGVYASAFADLWRSDASRVGGSSARTYYSPLTNGRRRALRDTFYLTVSRRYEETLPNIPHQPSPFLRELARRVVMDVWRGAFADDERWLRGLARYRVNSFLIIKHVWQRDGYDRTYPNTMPANAAQGGDAALRRLSLTAQKLGHRFCVHENYYDYYPNAEAFRPEHCALFPNGKPQLGWNNGAYRARILKPSLLMEYVRRFSPEIKRRYDCNAAYHDIMPTWRVDFDARAPGAGMIRRTHEYTKQLCDYDRRLFGGPVVFEAASAAMAGVYDGGCNHGRDTWRTPVVVAFELLKVHPKMSNHGFGYYERWLPWGYSSGWSTYVMTDRELDHYRATVVAFGRTGFIGQQLRRHPHALVREYHLMQAFGRAYTGRELRRLAYYVESDGWRGWVDAATARRLGGWRGLRATYEGGQQVFVNFGDSDWRVAGRALPRYGALTIGPRATAYTARVDGQIADFAAYDDVTYVDARSHQWLPPPTPPPITPSLGAWKDRGDGTFDLTIDWLPRRRLTRDRLVFWHFKDEPRILFQSDHRPPRPTTQWRPGEVVRDGPRRIKVPTTQSETRYAVVVGLYDKTGREPLLRGSNQVCVATLRVARRGGKVVNIAFEKCSEPQWAPGTDRAAYLEGANVRKRVLDFGDLATNGAVVCWRGRGRVETTPVPTGEPMRVGVAGSYKSVVALDAEGHALAPLASRFAGGKTWFDAPKDAVKILLTRN